MLRTDYAGRWTLDDGHRTMDAVPSTPYYKLTGELKTIHTFSIVSLIWLISGDPTGCSNKSQKFMETTQKHFYKKMCSKNKNKKPHFCIIF